MNVAKNTPMPLTNFIAKSDIGYSSSRQESNSQLTLVEVNPTASKYPIYHYLVKVNANVAK